MSSILLPAVDNKLERYNLVSQGYGSYVPSGSFSRTVYAAAHVVVNPLAERHPGVSPVAVDWDATLAYREHLWSMGFKVAEAMDTAQRGMGVDWPTALELVKRSLELARGIEGADLASGAGTDQLTDFRGLTLDDVKRAYIEQIEAIEGAGGRIILMASRALAAVAKGPQDYICLYNELIQGCRNPVILHWLGDMFDGQLAGYWGSNDVWQNMDTVTGIINDNADKIDGIKISLLETEYECELRKRLPAGVKMFTGDDFNYPELIEGDGQHYSHGLLGIFDPIAPVAAKALEALALGNNEQYRALMQPTIPLSRKIFESPTQFYKAGVVFIAWLNGYQDHFSMAGGMQSSRSISHYAEVFRLADRAGVLKDPQLAAQRMQQLLAVYGVTQ
ncbi:dihydrodipicolinate synthase family protein [Marinobacterium aestuarii]|uniref:Dihydrodipicolinate synthase family protein n=1 Tax=Marinobacterium aestuarii TaxID=1821621 RepID=A0A1A9EYC5_9GAMM|nr:dihydrodipicolinate synthase family protein [Marinobacterium aestuarii]ANG62750.1 dihydrodipicolinate synthase family protein [Marinobacterium aestuarii]